MIIKTLLIALATSLTTLTLSSCGFHLRGMDTTMNYGVGSAVLSLSDDATTFPLKEPLKNQLEAVGVNVVDDIGRQINQSNQLYTATIRVENVQLQKYELVGVLTEVRLVLSADVTYQTLQTEVSNTGSRMPVIVKSPVQVERSYQFNEASVSVEDQQGEQVKDWLYDALARRITDQYVALSLPKVAPSAVTSN